MNILLWVLQVLAALLYGSSGVMKVFMFVLSGALGLLTAFIAYGRMVSSRSPDWRVSKTDGQRPTNSFTPTSLRGAAQFRRYTARLS
jgi:hypothetical protein